MAYPIEYTERTDWNDFDGFGSSYDYRKRSKQARPYNIPTEYKIKHGYTMAATHTGVYTTFGGLANMGTYKGPWQAAWGPDLMDHFAEERTYCDSSCASKMHGKIKDCESLVLVDLAEAEQTLKMIEKRALQLLSFIKELRRFNFSKAASVLGVVRPKGLHNLDWKRDGKAMSDAFLEYHFGWEPLISDIGNGIEILQSPRETKNLRAASERISGEKVDLVDSAFEVRRARMMYIMRSVASVTVMVDNPSLYQANAMGFINPASVAWELVPFSFVVDWFVPVGNFLDSMTDWLGLTPVWPSYFTLLQTPVATYDVVSKLLPPQDGEMHIRSIGFTGLRTLGLPSISLAPRRFHGFSPVRAATAISLVLSGLAGIK